MWCYARWLTGRIFRNLEGISRSEMLGLIDRPKMVAVELVEGHSPAEESKIPGTDQQRVSSLSINGTISSFAALCDKGFGNAVELTMI